MDALITRGGVETRFSSIGLLVTDFQDSSPSMTTSKREVINRSGYVFFGAAHEEKRIVVPGIFVVPNAYALEEKKDGINELTSSDESFYVIKLLPTANLYDFELPGQKTSDLNLLTTLHHAHRYRYKVVVENELSYTFIGFLVVGTRIKFSSEKKAAELPFGETIPKTVLVSASIDYAETARRSQLEWSWIVRLTANQSQDGSFSLGVGDRAFTYRTQTALENGDTLLLKGMEVILDGLNANNKTNCEHLILVSANTNKIGIQTNLKGAI